MGNYTIVHGTVDEVIEKADELISNGWQIGGTAYYANGCHYQPLCCYHIAMNHNTSIFVNQPEERAKVSETTETKKKDKGNA